MGFIPRHEIPRGRWLQECPRQLFAQGSQVRDIRAQ